MMDNPFNFSQPIGHPDQFFGRRSIFAKVYARIGASRPQSISIVGAPRIGKSSLLNYLASDITKNAYLPNPDEYLYLLVPVGRISGMSIEKFYQVLCQQILHKTDRMFEVPTKEHGYYQFKRMVEALSKSQRKVILFLDDFHLITSKEFFPVEFYAFLRSLANIYNIAYVTTSYRDLQQLCALKAVERSPFFNIFTNMSLKPLQHHEAVQLIETTFYNSRIDIQDNTEWILSIAGLFPHTLQLACYIAFEHVRQSLDGLPRHYMDIEEQFYIHAIPFFEQCWNQFDEDHKRVLEMVCQARKLKPSQKYLLDELIRQNYIIKEDGYLQPFSSSFERFIADKCGFSPGSPNEQHRFMGRVREWLR